MGAPIRVLIADDVQQVRESIKAMLALIRDVTVIGEAGDGATAVALAESDAPDVVLMDINMPGMDGIAATEAILARRPCGVVVISVQGEAAYLRRAMQAGARDYLVKPFSPEDLADALHRAAAPAPPATPVTQPGTGSRGQVISLFSTKGGVGRSVLTANLAIWLAQYGGRRVAAVDLDLEFGVLASLMGAQPVASWVDLTRVEVPLTTAHVERVLTRPYRVHLGALAAPPLPSQAAEVDGEGRMDARRNYVSEVLEVLKASYEFVIIDCATSFRAATLTALDHSDQIWMVATPEVPSLQNVAKGLDILIEQLGYRRESVHLLLNRMHKDAPLSATEVEAGLGYPVTYTLPEDPGLAWAVSAGQPMVMKRARSAFAQAVAQLGSGLGQEKATGAPPPLPAKAARGSRLPPLLAGKRLFGVT